MKLRPTYILAYILSPILISCIGQVKSEDYGDAVLEWVGKEVLLPDSLMLSSGEWIKIPDADFTILSYYDSEGCTGCRMKLPYWNEFMYKTDSIAGSRTVALLMITASSDTDELNYLIKKNGFKYGLVQDKEDIINYMNHFSDDPKLQTFLLDGNRKILSIGNPLDSKQLETLYLRKIADLNPVSDETELEPIVISHDFGSVKPGISVSRSFDLTNETSDTLRVRDIITSCECTICTLSEKEISPGMTYTANVTFMDTIAGDFYRTATILFSDQRDIHIELSGTIN